MTLNKLVKLTTLWTTGPRSIYLTQLQIRCFFLFFFVFFQTYFARCFFCFFLQTYFAIKKSKVFIRSTLARYPNMSFVITKTSLFKYIENLPPKNENFQMKNSGSFHISAQTIDCGYSLEPSCVLNCLGEAVLMSTHNLCFWAEIRKLMYTPVNPSFTKVGFKGVELYRHAFLMCRN